MADKLNQETAKTCAFQLIEALERIEANHGWSRGDTVAVSIAAITELVARKLGPTKTIELFRGHADELETEHKRRATA